MTLTLWRGERLLGEIHPRRASTAERIDGVLLPAVGAAPLVGEWQVRVALPGRDVVWQQPLAPMLAAERSEPFGPRDPGPVALTPVPPEEMAGVEPSRRLLVRDASGEALGCRQVAVQAFRPLPDDPELALLPPAALVAGSVWLVWAAIEPAPAPT
jgi:hypothetical protein